MKKFFRLTATALILAALTFSFGACKENNATPSGTPVIVTSNSEPAAVPAESSGPEESSGTEEPSEKKSNDIVILVTSDVHCSPQKGFGYAGLQRIREKFQKEGCEVLLVDDGDEIEGHGEMFGTVTQGEQVIKLMNKMGYDFATPGNHEFAYGPDRFLEVSKLAEYTFLSCNITKNGQKIFKPYVLKEVRGKKLAFVGVTTPKTMGYYYSENLFKDSDGKIIYDFRGGSAGKKLLAAIQTSVDSARAEGADYVFVISHLGHAKKYKYYDDVSFFARNTKGVDAFLDGHSHDANRLEYINLEGKIVPRIGIGSKFSRVGYARISAETGGVDVGLWHWSSSISARELFGIENEMSEEVDKAMAEYKTIFYGKQGTSDKTLYVNDPNHVHSDGTPVRVITKTETNLGDFAADAFRICTGSDVAFIASEKFVDQINAGDISLRTMFGVLPASKKTITVSATGQQILDALEWACRSYPDANSSFLQVSGITFKIDKKVKTPCKTKKGRLHEIKGKRRVSNVKIGGTAIDPKKTYTVTSYLSLIWNGEDGFNMFKECKRVKMDPRLDFQILMDYYKNNLKGVIGSAYNNPGGQKRISAA